MKCVAFGGLEAMRLNRLYIAHCHAGLTFGCVPIIIQSRYMGIISFGQVRIKGESAENRSEVVSGKRSWMYGNDKNPVKIRLCKLFNETPEIEKDRMEKAGNAIWNLVNYTVDRAVALKTENSSYEWFFKNALTPFLSDEKGWSFSADKQASQYLFPIKPQHPLYPAIAYIEKHPERQISMREMADLCKLSHSYFSKMFTRVVGMNFTDYVIGRKVELAKKRLSESSESVADVAVGLGFTDTSYFIKVFKKFEGTTPLAYRKLRYLQK